jgi:predicted DNA-binding helix-hairpin-helix protein
VVGFTREWERGTFSITGGKKLKILTMPRIFINNCSIEELMSVSGIGAKVADKILELRKTKGDLELDDLHQVRVAPLEFKASLFP